MGVASFGEIASTRSRSTELGSRLRRSAASCDAWAVFPIDLRLKIGYSRTVRLRSRGANADGNGRSGSNERV